MSTTPALNAGSTADTTNKTLAQEGLALGKTIINDIVDPGADRDKARAARCNLYLGGALQGDVTSARYLLTGAQVVYAQKEKDLYANAIAQVTSQQPGTMAAARALGPMTSGFVDADSSTFNTQLTALENSLKGRIVDAAQSAGNAGLNTLANGSNAVNIPTTKSTLWLFALGVVLLVVFLRRKHTT